MTAANGLRALREKAAELEARLAATRHVGRSADDSVTATVTGQGRLIDLRIDDAALSGARVQNLGVGIVQAVQAARSAAQETSAPEVNALFGAGRAAHPGFYQDRAAQMRPEPAVTSMPQRRHARVEADHEESFEEVDFLSDDEEDRR